MDPQEKNSAHVSNPYQKIICAGYVYHIVQRATGKDILFLENRDYLYFLHILKETKLRFSFDIYCFCLMPNHLHLLVKINSANLSEGMKSLFTKYALYFNSKYKRKGHVFYSNYKAFLCLDDNYLITVSVYIHLNPYKARLVNPLVDYRWSSLSAYSKLPKNTFINYEYVLGLLSCDLRKASLMYEEIMDKAYKLNINSVIEDNRATEKFSLMLFGKIRNFLKVKKDSLNDIAVDIERVMSKKRLKHPHEFQARRYLIEQLKSRGYSIKDIACILNVSRQSIYNTLNTNFTKPYKTF